MDVEKTLDFAQQLCEDARGNVAKMNRIASNKALKFYLDNVVMLATVSRDTYATCYPQFMEEIDSLRLQAEKAQEAQEQHVDQGDRIATLEAKMDKLTAALEKFMEATDTEPEPEPEPKKRRTRKAKAKDSDTEDQDDPADDAEADAESDD